MDLRRVHIVSMTPQERRQLAEDIYEAARQECVKGVCNCLTREQHERRLRGELRDQTH